MVYDLKRLGDKAFEDLCRAIAVCVLGTSVQAFGDGPDGGRELSWEGSVGYPGTDPRAHWSGYGVLQAKFRRQGTGAKDLDWLLAELRKEFAAWTNPSAARVQRGRLPQFMIVVTNVRLTSAAGTGGIDRARAALAEYGKKLGLKGWALWDANQISMYLDAYPWIAHRFSAFITPSDVLSATKKTLDAISDRQRPRNPAAVCPSCGSQQMCQRMPALYQQERRETRTRVDNRSYSSTSVSGLGQRIAPPALPRVPIRTILFAGFPALCLLSSAQDLVQPGPVSDSSADLTAVSVSLIALAAMGFLVVRILRNRSAAEPEVKNAVWLWQRTWCCRRCDIAWVSTPDLPRELWGRPFRTNATNLNLRAIARGILAANPEQRQGQAAPQSQP